MPERKIYYSFIILIYSIFGEKDNIMERVFVGIIFSNAIIAFTLLIVCIQRRDKLDRGSRALQFFTCASCVWSLGVGSFLIQTTETGAHIARCASLLGTVLYINAIMMVLNLICGLPQKVTKFFERFALLGFILFFVGFFPGIYSFKITGVGMSFSFANRLYGNIYTAFFILCALMMLNDIISMLRSKRKSVVHFGKCFLFVWFLVICGSILDMLFPMLGFDSIPGSSILQFFGLVISWYALDIINHSRITVKNMSQKVYDSLSSPILMLDTVGNIVVFNDAAMDFLKLTRPDSNDYMKVNHFLALDKAEEKSEMNMDIFFDIPDDAEYLDNGELLTYDAFCKTNNVYCNVRANQVKDHFGELLGYIAVITDLSDQLKARNKLEEAREEAENANKAKSLFLANMSHEIRTPVNAIMGFSELALSEDIPASVKDYLSDIKNASNVLLGSINDILNISKIESGKMDIINEQYSLKVLLKNVCKIITVQAARKDLGFSLNLEKEIPTVMLGDDVRIQEILINLLNNSVKYTEHGGVKLSVSVEREDGKDAKLYFAVKDTGIGIKEEDLVNLFAAYERMDKEKNHKTEGTGLGLSIVRGYLDLMGGDIEVKSEYGKGSEFIVSIPQKIIDETPINVDEIMKSEEKEKRFLDLKINGLKVLAVDDNRVNLKVVSKTLEKYGVASDLANSGKEAIALCQNTEYPIVFMDHMMPEMDGVETMLALKEKYPYYRDKAKIVVLTANAIDGVKKELIDAGFDEYLSKPINYTELEKVLEKYTSKEMIS